MARSRSNQSVDARVLQRMRGRGPGAVTTPADFLDLAGRSAVDKALSRLVERGDLCRVDRGIYCYPAMSKLLGELSPKPDDVAQAMARQGGARLLISGAQAANLLGLSDQVPARMIFLTDGPARKAKVRNLTIELRQVSLKRLAVADRVSGTVAEALRFIRQPQIDAWMIERLRDRLNDEQKAQLVKDIPLVPAWIGEIFRAVAADTV